MGEYEAVKNWAFPDTPFEEIPSIAGSFGSMLSEMKEACRVVKEAHGIDIDLDNIPIDDELTYQLYQKGQTVGPFQFESAGMQKYLKELHPTVFEDLIAMNALYRPGPMDYIPSFVNRKRGEEVIAYDLPEMEEYLKETYGVTVYQEQVMQISQKVANFSKGKADKLRKAMGKKKKDVLDSLKQSFMEGALKNGHPQEMLEKIWKDWESFASYAFNKSHAACYAWVAYQTGYLKAHFPAEYLAANLTISKDSISEVQKFMEECKVMKIQVLGPDVNESELNFTVTPDNEIRFGLGGIKGVGEGAVDAIVSEREKNGPYTDFMNFLDRCDLHAINRKAIEVMIKTGCFDNFGSENTISRSTLIANMERAVEYAENKKQQKLYGQVSLFEEAGEKEFDDFKFDLLPEWTLQEKLASEKELIGFYHSGHPLDEYRDIIEKAETFNVATPDRAQKDKSYTIVGMLKGLRPFVTKKEKTMAFGQFEDINGEIDLTFFPKTWEKVAGRVQIDKVYGFTGKVDTSRDTPSFLIDDVIAPEELKEKSISIF